MLGLYSSLLLWPLYTIVQKVYLRRVPWQWKQLWNNARLQHYKQIYFTVYDEEPEIGTDRLGCISTGLYITYLWLWILSIATQKKYTSSIPYLRSHALESIWPRACDQRYGMEEVFYNEYLFRRACTENFVDILSESSILVWNFFLRLSSNS